MFVRIVSVRLVLCHTYEHGRQHSEHKCLYKCNKKFKKIYEHDMDLLILEEFVSEKSFAKIFLKKVGYADDYFKVEALHSCSDAHGESDLMLILHYPQGTANIP